MITKIVYKPGKITKNADARSIIKINHFNETSKLSYVFASYKGSDTEQTDTADEEKIHIDHISSRLFKNRIHSQL